MTFLESLEEIFGKSWGDITGYLFFSGEKSEEQETSFALDLISLMSGKNNCDTKDISAMDFLSYGWISILLHGSHYKQECQFSWNRPIWKENTVPYCIFLKW